MLSANISFRLCPRQGLIKLSFLFFIYYRLKEEQNRKKRQTMIFILYKSM